MPFPSLLYPDPLPLWPATADLDLAGDIQIWCWSVRFMALEQQLPGAGATLKRYPTSKGKGEAPARWLEGWNHVYNQTPYPPAMLRGLKHTLCASGPRDPTENEMLSQGSTKNNRKLKWRSPLLTSPRGSSWHKEVKARCRQREQKTWDICFY